MITNEIGCNRVFLTVSLLIIIRKITQKQPSIPRQGKNPDTDQRKFCLMDIIPNHEKNKNSIREIIL